QIDQLQKDIEATENDALKKAYQAEIEALKTEMQTNKELTTKAQAYVDRRIAELEKIVSEIPLNSAEAVLAEELEALKQAREDLAERNRLLQEEQSKQATIKEREAIRVADEVRASAVKGATLKLLNTALEEFAFPEIDAMCEETQEASEPVAMEPIDNTVGNPLTSTPNATKKNCKFPVTTGTAHIERLRVFKDNSNGARGRYLADPQPGSLYAEEPNFHNKGYFTIKSCKENIAYRVDYVGQGSKEIESGNIGIGNSSQLKIPFSDETSLYEEICITVSDTEFGENGKRCFDSVMLYEHTQSGVFSMSFYSNSSFPSQPEPDLDVNVYLYQNITDQLTQTTLSVEDVAFFITDGAEAFFSDETLTKAEVKSYLDDSSSDFIGPSEINENQILERVEGGERLYIAP
ncbi:MAG: hypothetical protein QF632_01185, partial [Candidatus Woesearchaeota archaeon]|nr:hypothetical protein [Candidatus Woesearchaeota archaeon]